MSDLNHDRHVTGILKLEIYICWKYFVIKILKKWERNIFTFNLSLMKLSFSSKKIIEKLMKS